MTRNTPKRIFALLYPLLLLFIFSPVLLLAQEHSKGRIEGQVNSADGKPVESINLILKGTGKGAVTDAQGRYRFEQVSPGTYTIEASFIGLKTQTIQATVKAGVTTTAGVITLSEDVAELQEVVVVSAADKFAKKKSDYVARIPLNNLENPQIYTVVPKELLEEQVATDFKSSLITAPGVNNVTVGVGSGGIGLSLRMRGFSGSHAAGAIRNGMVTNFVSLSDPVNLERIEVIKGPSGTLFGSTMISYGGLVNRVTKQAHDRFKGEVGYTAGSWGLSRFTVDINTPLNDDKTLLFRANAVAHKEGSFQDYGKANTFAFTPTFKYIVNDRLTLDAELELFKTKRNTTYMGLSGNGATATAIDGLGLDFSKSYASDEILSTANIVNAYLKATYKLSETWTSQTAFSFANTENNANYLFLLVSKNDSMSRRFMHIPSTFGVNQFQQNFIGDFLLGSMRNRLVVGLDYTQITTTDRRATLNLPTIGMNTTPASIYMSEASYQQRLSALTYTANKRNLESYSAYASDVINITPQLLAMASVRVDHYKSEYEDFNRTGVSPKFGVVYQLIPEKLSVFGNYMNGYSFVSPGVNSADPTDRKLFDPEQANQYEGGVKLELLKGKLSGSLSYYNIEVKDKVRAVPGEIFSIQDGTQESKGIEADLIANPFRGLHMIFGYGYNESKITKAAANEGKHPASTPAHTGSFWFSYKVMQGRATGFGIGFGGNAVSDSYMNDVNSFTVPGYHKFDATVFYDQPKYRVALKLNNVTNEKYWLYDSWASPQPTRQFLVNVAYRF
ncbi:MAG: TonB-dependent receptor [Candidatus Pseudobacter hemicellulosilyticus]|uniref:TonB-dependent receptor n=1 Tax=Candidatus Pseudobacter hemicellulosilyticus TaxID=3121375 RepID=A0AAJ5WPW8_9BACT|nr:MAG: TonB-dependent receptor [Pseudobacter sp.]